MERLGKTSGKTVDVFPGYKRELMRIVANLCYHNSRNQDEVRELGGLEIVLNYCNIDDKNPYIREWSLFAIRNLLTDNEENQELIKSLYVKGIPANPELKDLGLQVEIVNGVIRLSKIDDKQNPDQV